MLVQKTISFEQSEIKMDGDTGKFAGYASVFGGVDSYGDTIVRGAFESTLRKAKPKMFYNHAWDMPIGKWDVVKEDETGLYVEGTLTPGLSLAADVRAALGHGTLDGLSIGGMLKKGDWEDTEGGRVIRKWSNLMEISPVVFPADSAARIDLSSVKGEQFAELLQEEIAGLETLRDFESFLRDAGGLSKGVAKSLAARAKLIIERRDAVIDDAEAKMADLAARVARLTEIKA